MGAVKSGQIYVPLDPTYPEERLVNMLEDSKVSMVVTNNKNLAFAQKLIQRVKKTIQILNIETIPESIPAENIDRQIADDRIAYILYTSGSTGNPKAVIQSQQNIWHFIKNYTKNLAITAEDRLTLFSTFGHDAAVMDIYSGLLNGATLYPVNIKDQVSFADLVQWLITEKITIYHSVPTVFRYVCRNLSGEECFSDLRFIVLGGESIIEHDIKMFKQFFSPDTTLLNLYGQSESSYNSGQFISHNTSIDKITLGEPVEGTQFLIVTDGGAVAGELEIGEIIIASEHVALGYWEIRKRQTITLKNILILVDCIVLVISDVNFWMVVLNLWVAKIFR